MNKKLNRVLLSIIAVILLASLSGLTSACGVSISTYQGTTTRNNPLNITGSWTNNCSTTYNGPVMWSNLHNGSLMILSNAITSNQSTITLAPGESKNVTLTFNIPQGANPDLSYTGYAATYQVLNGSTVFYQGDLLLNVINEPPVINLTTIPSVVGQELVFDVSSFVSDANDPIINYSLSGQPSGMVINGSGVISGWTPSNNNAVSFTLTVTDAYGATTSVLITVNPSLHNTSLLVASSIVVGGPSQARGVLSTINLPVINDGYYPINLTNIELLGTSGQPLSNTYNVTYSASNTQLQPGDSTNLTINLVVPLNAEGRQVVIGSARITANSNQSTITKNTVLYLQAKSNLVIDEFKIVVDSDSTTLTTGDDYELSKNKQATIKAKLRNDGSTTIDAKITVTDDEDYNIDEESDYYQILPGESRTISVNTMISSSATEPEARVMVYAEGVDSVNNYVSSDEEHFNLELTNNNDGVRITNLALQPRILYSNSNNANLVVTVTNDNSYSVSGWFLDVNSNELNYHRTITGLQLSPGESKTINLPITYSVNEEFTNQIMVSLYDSTGDLKSFQVADYQSIVVNNTVVDEEQPLNQQRPTTVVEYSYGKKTIDEGLINILLMILITLAIVAVVVWVIVYAKKESID